MRKQRIVSSGSGKRATWPAPRTFLALDDTPKAYTGKAGQIPVVNVAENALEFKTEAAIDEYKVKTDAGDPAGTYLDSKMDGTTLETEAIGHTVRIKDGGHAIAGIKHSNSTKAQLDAKISDGDLYSSIAGEITATTAKAAPIGADKLLIEDSADGDKKKSISISTLPAALPAAHDLAGVLHNASTKAQLDAKISDGDLYSSIAGEIAATTAKATIADADYILIEDSADGNKKKASTAGKMKRYDHIRTLFRSELFMANASTPIVYSTLTEDTVKYYCMQFRKAVQDILILQCGVPSIRWDKVNNATATINVHLWMFPTVAPGANNKTYWYVKAFHIPQGATVELDSTGSDANQLKTITAADQLHEVLFTGIPVNIPAGAADGDGIIQVKISRDKNQVTDLFADICYCPFAAITIFLDGV